MVLNKLSRFFYVYLILFVNVLRATSYLNPGVTWNYPSRENIITPRSIKQFSKSRQPVHAWGFATTPANPSFTHPSYGFKTIRSFREKLLHNEFTKENTKKPINIETQIKTIGNFNDMPKSSIQDLTTIMNSVVPLHFLTDSNHKQINNKNEMKYSEINSREDNIKKMFKHNSYKTESIETNNGQQDFESKERQEDISNQNHGYNLNSFTRHTKKQYRDNQEKYTLGDEDHTEVMKKVEDVLLDVFDSKPDLNTELHDSDNSKSQEVTNEKHEPKSNRNHSSLPDHKRTDEDNNNAKNKSTPYPSRDKLDHKNRHEKDKHIGYSKTLIGTKGPKKSSPVHDTDAKNDSACKQPNPAIKEEKSTVAGGLRCYSCDNQTTASCQVITPYTNQTVCTANQDKCYVIHTKNIFTDKFTMRRTCGHRNACSQIDSVATEVKKCFSCRADLCNSGFSNNIHFGAVLLSSITILIL